MLKDFDKVIINPAHGGHDPGAVADGVQEKDNCLLDALELSEILTQRGCRNALTRTHDEYHSPREIARIANGLGTRRSLFISLHNNKFYDPRAHGLEIFVHPTAGGEIRRIARDMAVETVKNFPALGPLRKEAGGVPGVKSRGFTVLSRTEMPALLIESGFISNEEERKVLSDPADRHARMRIIADVICQGQSMGAEVIEDDELEETADSGSGYTVEVPESTLRKLLERNKNVDWQTEEIFKELKKLI